MQCPAGFWVFPVADAASLMRRDSSQRHADLGADPPHESSDHEDMSTPTRADDRDSQSAEKDGGEHDRKQSDGKNGDKDKDKDKDGDKDGDTDGKQKPRSRWPLVILAIVVVLAIVAGVIYWLMTRDLESTDDAYTEGNAVSIAPKISGYVTELNIDDNSFVHAGDVLLRIDQRDYITARDQAQANLALARAQLTAARIDLETTRVRAPANLVQARAQLEQARASQHQAQREARRQRAVDQRATTQTSVDQAVSQLLSQDASVNAAEAQVQVAGLVRQTIATAEATVAEREAQLAQAQASLDQALVNLSYTIIRAPEDGHITRRNVDRGTFAQAGQQVFYLVTPALWITANFKETQLNRMRPGQPVTIDVDAYPAMHLHGHVGSIQAGSGDRFSTFPAENATGNYVKIVRRLPVKIFIDDGVDMRAGLPLGLSVTPTVTVK